MAEAAARLGVSAQAIYLRVTRGTLRAETIELPGAVKELRGDVYGRWILARPEQGDSVWVIDVSTGNMLGSIAARWTADLPAVAPPHTLLVRRGADLAALDLSATGFTELGRIAVEPFRLLREALPRIA